jgi:hypothetical protein
MNANIGHYDGPPVPLDPRKRERLMSLTYSRAPSEMESARKWTAARLHKLAREMGMITYGDLARELNSTGLIEDLEASSAALATLLAQVNVEDEESGHPPLISSLVVHQDDGMPGKGFWGFASELGMSPGSSPEAKEAFWMKQVQRCHEYWSHH